MRQAGFNGLVCWLAIVGTAAGLAGCDKNSVATLMGGRGESVQAGDFAGEAREAPSEPVRMPVRTVAGEGARLPGTNTPMRNAASPVVSLGGGDSGSAAAAMPAPRAAPMRAPEITTTVGAPSGPTTGGTPITIDAVVGQINGKPVLVSEILDPLDGVLRAAGTQAKDLRSWQKAAAEPIVRELRRRIEDELVLSEARSGLSAQQKAGLLHFLGQIESSLISAQQGSEVKADEEMRKQTGRTLKQEAVDEKDKALITNELRSKVLPRVVVSWRDVKNEYERNHERYHPPAKYTFRMIYAPADKPDVISRIREALEGSGTFADVAGGELNEFNRREKGVMERSIAGAQGEGEFFPAADVNNALRSLTVGQVLGPIEYAPDKNKPDVKRAAWVYLERIDQPQGVSLYDAQLELQNELREERTSAEIQRYFDGLRKRGNVSKIEVMADKLMRVATDRYAPRFSSK